VIPDPHKDIGLNILSYFHYGSQAQVATYQSLTDALQSLSCLPGRTAEWSSITHNGSRDQWSLPVTFPPLPRILEFAQRHQTFALEVTYRGGPDLLRCPGDFDRIFARNLSIASDRTGTDTDTDTDTSSICNSNWLPL